MAAGQWAVISDGGVNHVVPIGDMRDHCEDCWCEPTDDEGVMVHHSADHREDFETGARKPS